MCCNNILFCCNIFFKILRTKKSVEPGNFLINCQHDLNKLQRKSALNRHIYIYIYSSCCSYGLDIFSLFFHSRTSSYLLYFPLLILFIFFIVLSAENNNCTRRSEELFRLSFFTYCIFLAV